MMRHDDCQPRTCGVRCRGMTLIELVISTSVMVIVLGGLSTAVVFASKAAGADSDPDAQSLDAASALERMLSELSLAKTVTARTSSHVTFTVADRDADGSDEKITYDWDGDAGDPLTRAYNGGAPQTVLGSVQSFNLAFSDSSADETTTDVTSTVRDVTVFGEPDLLGFINDLLGSLLGVPSQTITPANSAAQPIAPTLPANAIAWRPTLATFVLRTSGSATGRIQIEFRTAHDDWSPTDRVLASFKVNESDLPNSFDNRAFAIRNCPWIAPTQRICVVVRDDLSAASADVALTTDIGHTYWRGGPSEGSWNKSLAQSMPVHVRADVQVPGADQVTTVHTSMSVQCEMTVGERTLRSSTLLYNQPETP